MAAEERLARQRWSIWPFKLCFFKRSFTFRRFLHSDKRQKKTRKWRMMNKSWPKYIYIYICGNFCFKWKVFSPWETPVMNMGMRCFHMGMFRQTWSPSAWKFKFFKNSLSNNTPSNYYIYRWWFPIFLFSPPKIGVSWSNLTNIFRMGWFNHQPDILLEHMTYTNQLRI